MTTEQKESKEQKESIPLPKDFNPGIIQPLKRRKMGVALLLSALLPGAGHFYTDQKKVGLFFFLLGLGTAYLVYQTHQYYWIAAFYVLLLGHTIRSVKTFLFRKRYVYLAGVHGWEYRSW